MWQVYTIRLDLPHAPTPQSLKRGLVCPANIRNPNDKKQASEKLGLRKIKPKKGQTEGYFSDLVCGWKVVDI